jgi:hypothetical protein
MAAVPNYETRATNYLEQIAANVAIIAGAGAPRDVPTFVYNTSVPGQLTITCTWRSSTAVLRPFVAANFLVSSDTPLPITVTVNQGMVTLPAPPLTQAVINGFTGPTGEIEIVIVGTPADVVSFVASNVSSAPGIFFGSRVIP